MLAKELISDIVPSLCTSDTGTKALSWMEVFRISHLPIVNNVEFLGLISDKDIYDMNMADEPIGNHHLSLFSPFVYANQHIFEVISLVSELKLSVVPVVNNDKKYMGVITLHDLLHYFADATAVNQPGGIIEIELHVNDYSLSEIAQIVESNDSKILGLYLNTSKNSNSITLTIKVNSIDITSIIHTFERYNYTIKATYLDNNEIDTMLQNRYESFINYLNI